MAYHTYSAKERQMLVDLWPTASLQEIADAFGTNKASVKNLAARMRREGVELPARPTGREQATPAEIADKLARARAKGAESGLGNKRNVQILELRLAGHRPKQIAAQLNISVYQVKTAIADPDRAHRQSRPFIRAGRCVDCGAPTVTRTSRYNRATGRHDSVSQAAERCDKHAREARWREHRNTKESIIAYLQALGRRLDRTPVRNDLKKYGAPFSITTVYNVFGKNGWSVALREAGFVAREARGQDRDDDRATEVTWKQRSTVLRIGGALEFDGDQTLERQPADTTGQAA